MKILLIFLLPLQIFAQELKSSIKYLALGDSYTIGQSVAVDDRWPNQFSDTLNKLGYSVTQNDILATTGWTTTNLLYSLENSNLDRDYNLISILIGVNNFYQGRPVNLFRTELPELIDSALQYCNGDTNALFLVTIPDYGYTPFGSGSQASISENTDLYNGIIDSVALRYQIPVFNITPISRRGEEKPDLVANDGLHPSGKQYKLWVDFMIENMLNPSFIHLMNSTKVDFILQNKQVHFTPLNSSGKLRVYNALGKLLHQELVQEKDSIHIQLIQGVNHFQFQSQKGVWSKTFIR